MNCEVLIHNDPRASTERLKTEFLFTVETTYKFLKETFGPPTFNWTGDPNSDGKVRVEWVILTDNNVIITIYDWKETKPLHKVTDWHIGGMKKDKKVVEMFLCGEYS